MKNESRSKVLIALLFFTILGSMSALVHAATEHGLYPTYVNQDEESETTESSTTTTDTSTVEDDEEEEDDTP